MFVMLFSRFPFRAWRRVALPLGRVLVAKTTHLGDLVISLPMATALKRRDPACTVIFLTHRSTVEVARSCPDIDEVVAVPDTQEALVDLLASLNVDIFIQVNNSREGAVAAHRAGIPVRIGSLFRLYNWPHFTHLVAISRTYAGLNKRQLDLEYLLPLGITVPDLQTVADMYRLTPQPSPKLEALHPHHARGRRTVIISPALVTARAHQWPLASYASLIDMMASENVHWFICGLTGEREQLLPLLERYAQRDNVTDLVGALSLADFMSFVSSCDGLVAGSTGPLHLAAALGIHTVGLFQSHRTDLNRWHPVGRSATTVHSNVRCVGERRAGPGKDSESCPCITAIPPDVIADRIRDWFDRQGAAQPIQISN
ncbi:glycosyltransferase family 9 protein [Herbaspirillum sp. HC18]|nr:glycosyltransferase family 9 protein [Herbaspirillum sp. HC18]